MIGRESSLKLALIAVAIGIGVVFVHQAAQAQDRAAEARTRAVVAAATAYLNSLSPEQRKQGLFWFTPQKGATGARFRPQDGISGEQYGLAVWTDRPISDLPRPGLQLGSLSPMQREAVMRLLQTLLSPEGYQKVLDVMSANQALHDSGVPFPSGRDSYTIGVFGAPSATAPWMVEFGGHHLGLNVVIDGQHAFITPSLIATQPAVFQDGAKTVRVLANESDKAFALMDTLDADQRKQAILHHEVAHMVQGPGHATDAYVPEGLKASAMTAHQKAMLLDLISEWANTLNEAYAKPRMAAIEAGLDETYFAWSGPLTHQPGMDGASYFRIQGPRLWIEYSPEAGHGPPEQHIHTIYRDPTNEYGQRFTLP
jgi:Protein of unknown function (DUF3500)